MIMARNWLSFMQLVTFAEKSCSCFVCLVFFGNRFLYVRGVSVLIRVLDMLFFHLNYYYVSLYAI